MNNETELFGEIYKLKALTEAIEDKLEMVGGGENTHQSCAMALVHVLGDKIDNLLDTLFGKVEV